ncbi:hypothetical protein PCO31111_02458 [Pandoraea communis]|uniref:Uncharacterized protein n=1 Tax=Pandoraea communis TaxID=2508297 RepID=A0A5E4V7Z5_9BURK|nr:hypothetical protein PCO31111_02458 [Pandoraea communis]
MAKQVSINSGVVFGTLKAAKEYFDHIYEVTPCGALLSEPNRTDVLDIHRRYRFATGWSTKKCYRCHNSMG